MEEVWIDLGFMITSVLFLNFPLAHPADLDNRPLEDSLKWTWTLLFFCL